MLLLPEMALKRCRHLGYDSSSLRLLPLYSSVLALSIYLQNSTFGEFSSSAVTMIQQAALVWHLYSYRIGKNSYRRKSEAVPE